MNEDFVTFDEVKQALSNFYTKRQVYNKDESDRLAKSMKGSSGIALGNPTYLLNSVQSATGIQLYNTVDQTTNFEKGTLSRVSNVFTLSNQNGGTGTQRNIELRTINSSGGTFSRFTVGRAALPYFEFHVQTATGTSSGNWMTIYSISNSSTASSGTVNLVSIAPTINQSSTAGANILHINPTQTALGSGGLNLILTQVGGVDKWKVDNFGHVTHDSTITAGGTTGAQTINKPSGTVNFAAAATSLVVTNSLCTTSSIITGSIRTHDATAVIKNIVPGHGSFTITLSEAATAETSVGFIVRN